MRDALGGFLRRRLDPAERYGLRATLFAIAVALVGIPFGLLLDQVVRNGPLARADVSAARALHDIVRRHFGVVAGLKVLTFLGSVPFLTSLVVLAGAWLLARRRKRPAAYLVMTSLAGGGIDSIVKILVNRDRPNLANPLVPLHGKSFPSGHTMSSTIVFGALLLIFMPRIPARVRPVAAAGVLTLVAAIAGSRLALGVHYITDVAGGFVLGLAWLSASTAAFSIWREERGKDPVDPLRGLEPETAGDDA